MHLGALNPRDLPREILVDEQTTRPIEPTAPKKKGRPTRLDKAKKTKAVLHNLEKWLENTSEMPFAAITQDMATTSELIPTGKTEVEATLGHYQNAKSHLLNSINFRAQSSGASERHAAFQQANQFVLDRLKETEELLGSDGVSLPNDPNAALARVERAVKEFIEAKEEGQAGGILNLLAVRNGF